MRSVKTKELLIDGKEVEMNTSQTNPRVFEGTIGSVMDIRILRSGIANLHKVEKVDQLEKNWAIEYYPKHNQFHFNGEARHAGINKALKQMAFGVGIKESLTTLDKVFFEKREEGLYVSIRWMSDRETLEKKLGFKADADSFITLKQAKEALDEILDPKGKIKVGKGEGFLSEEQATKFKAIFWVFINDIEEAARILNDLNNFVENDPRVKKFRFGKQLD
jgi:hypothetical protein